MDRNELAKAINAATHLRGRFILRSGTEATEYFDKFQFASQPRLLDAVTDALAELLPEETDVLAGLELGGVPLAAVLATKTGIPAVYVRKQRKAYGTCRVTEGVPIDGRRVVVVEDIVTTGGQIVKSVDELREEGAVVDHAIAVVDRESGGTANLAAAGIALMSVFTAADLRVGEPIGGST